MPIELLAPAGNLEKAKTAILYGADAVYIGGQQFSLRARASNFNLEQIEELCQFAHAHGSKVHVTVNIIPHPADFKGLEDYLHALDKAGVDAIISASPAIILRALKMEPGFEVHVSTQRSVLNEEAVRFWAGLGADRVVLGRETPVESIAQICAKEIVPIEVFIHGGMCISFSGRCVLSNHMTNRDANRGGCAQSCRWKYHLYENGTEISDPDTLFSMSSKDLQAVEYVEEFMKLGIDSLKIEGRMKSAYYLATVVSSYRRLIDHIYSHGHADPAFLEMIRREISKAENRPTGPGFYRGLPDHTVQLYRNHDETVTQEYIAQIVEVLDHDEVILQVKNRFEPETEVEVFGPHILSSSVRLETVTDMDGNHLEICNQPMMLVRTRWNGPKEKHAMLRRLVSRTGNEPSDH